MTVLSLLGYDMSGTIANRIRQSNWYKNRIHESHCLFVSIERLERVEALFEPRANKRDNDRRDVMNQRMLQIL